MSDKPKWIDESPDRTGKRLSNIHWDVYPVWKRDEESFKMVPIDKELVIYNNTMTYVHNGKVIHTEVIKTQGSQVIPVNIPEGYKLKNPDFKPINGKNTIEVVKEKYTINITYTHSQLTTPLKGKIEKPYNDLVTLNDIKSAVALPANYSVGSKYTHTDFNITDDISIEVPLTYSMAWTPIQPIAKKKVTIKYYEKVGNENVLIKTDDTQRITVGSYNYKIVVPRGFERIGRTDNNEYETTIMIRRINYIVNIRYIELNADNTIKNVFKTFRLIKPFEYTLKESDFQSLPEIANEIIGEDEYRVTLSWKSRTGDDYLGFQVLDDANIDIPLTVSRELIPKVQIEELNIIEEGIGVYSYGLPCTDFETRALTNTRVEWVALKREIYKIDTQHYFLMLKYDPVNHTIVGDCGYKADGSEISFTDIKNANFKIPLNISPRTTTFTNFRHHINAFPNPENEFYFITDIPQHLITKSNDIIYYHIEHNTDTIFTKMTLCENANMTNYNSDIHYNWIIISDLVWKPTTYGLSDISALLFNRVDNPTYKPSIRSLHGTLPYVDINTLCIEAVCPLKLYNRWYYLLDNVHEYMYNTKTRDSYYNKVLEPLYGLNNINNQNELYTITHKAIIGYLIPNKTYIQAMLKDRVFGPEGDLEIELYSNYTDILGQNIHIKKYPVKEFVMYKHKFNNEFLINDEQYKAFVHQQECSLAIVDYHTMINHGIYSRISRKELYKTNSTHLNDDDILAYPLTDLMPPFIDVHFNRFNYTTDIKLADHALINKTGADIVNIQNKHITYNPVPVNPIFSKDYVTRKIIDAPYGGELIIPGDNFININTILSLYTNSILEIVKELVVNEPSAIKIPNNIESTNINWNVFITPYSKDQHIYYNKLPHHTKLINYIFKLINDYNLYDNFKSKYENIIKYNEWDNYGNKKLATMDKIGILIIFNKTKLLEDLGSSRVAIEHRIITTVAFLINTLLNTDPNETNLKLPEHMNSGVFDYVDSNITITIEERLKSIGVDINNSDNQHSIEILSKLISIDNKTNIRMLKRYIYDIIYDYSLDLFKDYLEYKLVNIDEVTYENMMSDTKMFRIENFITEFN